MTDNSSIERSRTISASPQQISEQIADFRQWLHWSPWEGLDPDLRRTYEGPEHGVGAVYEWSGNRKAGAGRMEILQVTPQGVAVDLLFTKPFRSHNRLEFSLTPTPDGAGTEVVWRMIAPRTLSSRIMGLFMNMDKVVGGDFERGLAQLDARCTV
jgi:hypothetical protein